MARKSRSVAELKQEIETLVSELEVSTTRNLAGIPKLELYERIGSASAEELARLRLAGDEMRDRAFGEKMVRAKRDLLCPCGEGDGGPTKKTFEMMIHDLRLDIQYSKLLHRTLERREAVFQRYFLPRRVIHDLGRPDELMEIYLERLREYVRVTWQEPAKTSRVSENSKSLLDLIIRFDKSAITISSSASTMMRDWFNEIGSIIAGLLVEYFLIISDSFKEDIDVCLDETEAVIKSLSIEESSAVVAGFLASIQFCREKIHQAKGSFDRADDGGDAWSKQRSMTGRECDLFRLIVLEIMKMEVQFQYPTHSPVDGVFFYMLANASVYRDFLKEKVERIAAEIRRIKIESSCGNKDPRTEFYKQVLSLGAPEVLRLGVSEAWKGLDLHKYKSK